MTSINLNHDPVVICPYDSNHLLAKSRIAQHIAKCEKKYPEGYKVQCPYDATHRFFPYELEAHVEKCPMKLVCLNQNCSTWRRIDTETDDSVLMSNQEDEWEEDKNDLEPLPKETEFTTIKPRQHVAVNASRGNSMAAKRITSTLRRPFGQSESMMLEISSQSGADDDTDSFVSRIDIGRGKALQQNRVQATRGIRGTSMLHRRGFRGRLS